MGYKKYSDQQIAETMIILAINRYDFEKTAEQTGISKATIKRWNKLEPKKTVPELLDRAIERMLMVIPDNWSGRDWAVAVGILMDKYQLLRGEPTQRTESIMKFLENLPDEELDQLERQFLDAASRVDANKS
jgi:hypothetical protein